MLFLFLGKNRIQVLFINQWGSFQRFFFKMSLTNKKNTNMRRFLYVLLFAYGLIGCQKDDENAPAYIKSAVEHCGCPQRKLEWLQTLVTSGNYPTPGARLPAPIRRISIASSGKTPIFIIDSDINSCFTCPWATLNCKGEPFTSGSSSTVSITSIPTRDKIIWERY